MRSSALSLPEAKLYDSAEKAIERSVIDRFGEDIQTRIIDDSSFTAAVQVQPSNTFYAWVFTFCGDIEILEPEHVRDEYRRMAQRAAGIEQGNAICQ